MHRIRPMDPVSAADSSAHFLSLKNRRCIKGATIATHRDHQGRHGEWCVSVSLWWSSTPRCATRKILSRDEFLGGQPRHSFLGETKLFPWQRLAVKDVYTTIPRSTSGQLERLTRNRTRGQQLPSSLEYRQTTMTNPD